MSAQGRKERGRRRGSVYLALLICSMIVTIIGLSAMTVTRVRQRTVESEVGFAESRLAARSAVELGLLWMNTEPNWRTKYPSGAWVTDQRLGGGKFTLMGVDPVDGNLANSPSDPVVLTGTGESGAARFMLRARLQPQGGPMDALRSGLTANGTITVEAGETLTMEQGPVSTNGQLRADGAVVGDIEAMSVAGSGSITDPDTSKPLATAMPAATVMSDYVARGTTILRSGTIQNFTLSPTSNPWGPVNPDGVYVIDTQGSDLDIEKAVVSGTLIVKAPGRRVRLREGVHFKNFRADYPTLIVDGNLEVDLETSGGVLEGIVGALVDLLFMLDGQEHPKLIEGLVHVKGNLEMRKYAHFKGAVICEGTALIRETNKIVHDPAVWAVPPVGYTMPNARMAIVPGTWQQVTLP